ncbi:MAG TPA: hypothetical protein VFV67_05235 [Actinophytocola sp.]|uniref:hypothetical protein n=1 Tax=Actinophytocola sp. TaxID=1872138 RepID=UPI002DBDE076|nr:hypothetical protein [Actinophytocola sp.]HEU5470036.1 hypothetical protein [Actinophytocola sp.]
MAAYTLLVPLLAIGVLALVLRWASNLDTDRAHRKDYGLLREVARVPSSTAARVVEERLQEVGIKATTVPAEDGNGMRILVFPGDENTAIRTLLGYPSPGEDHAR